MLTFGAAVLDGQSPLKAVFARMTSVKRTTDEARVQQALGWTVFRLARTRLSPIAAGRSDSRAGSSVDTTRKRVVIAWINGRGAAVTDLVGLALDRARLQ